MRIVVGGAMGGAVEGGGHVVVVSIDVMNININYYSMDMVARGIFQVCGILLVFFLKVVFPWMVFPTGKRRGEPQCDCRALLKEV